MEHIGAVKEMLRRNMSGQRGDIARGLRMIRDELTTCSYVKNITTKK